MSNNIVIKVENLSKRYRVGKEIEQNDSFISALTSFFKSPFRNFHEASNQALHSSYNHSIRQLGRSRDSISFALYLQLELVLKEILCPSEVEY